MKDHNKNLARWKAMSKDDRRGWLARIHIVTGRYTTVRKEDIPFIEWLADHLTTLTSDGNDIPPQTT